MSLFNLIFRGVDWIRFLFIKSVVERGLQFNCFCPLDYLCYSIYVPFNVNILFLVFDYSKHGKMSFYGWECGNKCIHEQKIKTSCPSSNLYAKIEGKKSYTNGITQWKKILDQQFHFQFLISKLNQFLVMTSQCLHFTYSHIPVKSCLLPLPYSR